MHGGKLSKERQKPCTFDLLVEQLVARLGNSVNLKNILGQIETYGFNCHWVAPLLAVHDNCIMAHRDAGGAGAIHFIRFRENMLHRRETVMFLISWVWRILLHSHQAGLSAQQTSVQIAAKVRLSNWVSGSSSIPFILR